MTNSNLASAFVELDRTLAEHSMLWQEQPFIQKELSWFTSYPEIKNQLLSLDDSEARALHANSQTRRSWFKRAIPDLCDALHAYTPVPVKTQTELSINAFDQVGIPGRKWQQVLAFAGSLSEITTPIIDWCSGKGHLSRVVQRNQGRTVHCLEWDAKLVEQGKALAKRDALDLHYHHQNVMERLPEFCAEPDNTHIALHACGDLHLQLLQHTANNRVQSVVLSPCCYQKTKHVTYAPLSAIAKQSTLRIGRSELQLAVQETVTAQQGEQKLREKAQQWRLGFDALQRELRGIDAYLNIPSVKNALLREEFPAFCQWAAKAKDLTLPEKVDYAHYLALGKKRYAAVFRLELVRQLFNRPLELWLVLDRALYLEEKGYRVSLNTFCDTKISPRNLLIQAHLA